MSDDTIYGVKERENDTKYGVQSHVRATSIAALKRASKQRERPVETPVGIFKSMDDASKYYGISEFAGRYRERIGKWRYVTI